MSKRRDAYSLVYRTPEPHLENIAAAFKWGLIMLRPHTHHLTCNRGCGDPDCVIWNDSLVMNWDGSMHPRKLIIANASECEMDDVIICRLINATEESAI